MRAENNGYAERFVQEVRKILSAYLNRKGIVIYSNKTTLRLGAVLFYGFNPGYEPAKEHRIFWSIGESLSQFANDFEELKSGKDAEGQGVPFGERLHADFNLIDDQRWPFQNLEDDFPAGRAPYQEHTRNLLKAVGRGDALITNLLFLQAARPNQIRAELNGHYDDFEAACWQVHDLIFEMTKPSVLITCASVLDNGLRKRLSLSLIPPMMDSGYGPRHRKWQCKHWRGSWRDGSGHEHPIAVCQIPHMTYYDISKRAEVAKWARAIVAS